MADICIVYSHTNEERVRKLFDLLSSQWDVWWDDMIVGDFGEAIEQEIPQSKCLLPILSTASRNSDEVRDELRIAKLHGIKIIPAKIEDCSAPYGFGGYSSVDLQGWNGETDHPGYRQLLRKLSSVVPPCEKPKRPGTIASGKVPLPALFMSVSSFETRLRSEAAVNALGVFGAPIILVSAYDFVPYDDDGDDAERMVKVLSRFRAKGGFVLIDSGNYEASRLDVEWTAGHLKSALEIAPHDWAFCFDVMEPEQSVSKAAKEIVASVKRGQKITHAPVIPIVHAYNLKGGGYSLKATPRVVCEVAKRLEPPLIAIPERELGKTLIDRARTVRRIREELNKLPFYQPLHLLGTGNPWSIAVLSAAGADSFDGLEWCRVLIDRDNGTFNHFQNYDFFAYQAGRASPFAQSVLLDEKTDVASKAAFHNIDYYAELSQDLQQAAAKGDFEALLIGLLGKLNVTTLKKQMPELFS